jgi:hypothetical protein
MSILDSLNVAADSIPEEVKLPEGVYEVQVNSYKEVVSPKAGTPGIRFELQILNPVEVDEDELAKLGDPSVLLDMTVDYPSYPSAFWLDAQEPDPNDLTASGREKVRKFHTKLRMLVQYLTNVCGLKKDGHISQMLDEAVRSTHHIRIEHVPSQDGSRTYVNATKAWAE